MDKAIELLDDLALNILYDDSNKNADPFWEKTSADYFSGVALGLFEDAEEVIRKSMTSVQQIAALLGDNAAETEIMLNSIIEEFNVNSSEAGEDGLMAEESSEV